MEIEKKMKHRNAFISKGKIASGVEYRMGE